MEIFYTIKFDHFNVQYIIIYNIGFDPPQYVNENSLAQMSIVIMVMRVRPLWQFLFFIVYFFDVSILIFMLSKLSMNRLFDVTSSNNKAYITFS